MSRRFTWRVLAPVALGATLVTSCGSSSSSKSGSTGASGTTAVSVDAGDTSCQVSTEQLPAGRHTFAVKNTGSNMTEVYVYAPGDRVVGEVENIGPSTSRSLVVDLPAGGYEVACKPGMTGHGIRSALAVAATAGDAASSTAASPSADPALTQAISRYRAYLRTETDALITDTAAFTAAVARGDVTAAKQLYPAARQHYERIEPVAESFGDLDPLIDERAADVAPGTSLVGFHRLERDLWAGKLDAASTQAGTGLLAHCRTLAARVATLPVTPLTMGNGAKSLLDEVAKTKVTGEEEHYSHIDLVDFAANVAGSREVVEALRPVLSHRDPALLATLDTRFASLQKLLDSHRDPAVPGGYQSYQQLTPAQVRALAVAVDAVSEPLGRLAGALT